MNDLPDFLRLSLRARRHRWLVTGAAGFIGSHLVEQLLALDQRVHGLDNLRTGRASNLEDVRSRVTPEQWQRFRFFEADITRPADLSQAVPGTEFVLHQAAIGSVPFSIAEPRMTHEINVSGFLNVLEAARATGVARVVYASSSAVYGDSTAYPAREAEAGRPLSPYAVTKAINEQYADVYGRCYGLSCVGLRYFNVFGRRQDPAGEYAAVIPRWVQALCRDQGIVIYGDGSTSRDFCPVSAVVDANLRAALQDLPGEAPRVFNVGLGRATTLAELQVRLATLVQSRRPEWAQVPVRYEPFRAGDVRRSCADLERIERWLGFAPRTDLTSGLEQAVDWFLEGEPTESGRPGIAVEPHTAAPPPVVESPSLS